MFVNLTARQGPESLPPVPSQSYLEESDAPKMLAVVGTLFALAMICVLLRVYVRTAILKTFGVDDWIMMIAAISSAACFSFLVALTHIGVGHHVEYFIYVRPDVIGGMFQILWFYSWTVVIAYSCIKISIAFFLLRLSDHRRYWRWLLHTIIIVLVLFTVGSILSLLLQCSPVQAAWNFDLRPPTGNAKCYSEKMFRNTAIFNSVFNLTSDLILALIPMPIIWKIQMNLRTRISLCIVLGLGLFTCGVAIYKIPLQFRFFEEKDWSGHGAWYYIWQQIEMNVGIIAACLPTLKPISASLLGTVSALTSSNRYGSRHTVAVPSRPYVSHGYLRQAERSGVYSYAMNDLHAGNDDTHMGRTTDKIYLDDVVAHRAHRGRVSCAAGSEDSILPAHKGIMRTVEVEVS